MKKIILLLVFAVLWNSTSWAQWQWAISAGNNSPVPESGNHVLLHPNGNIICTGSYSGGLLLDKQYFSNINGSQFTAEFTPEGVPVRSFTIREADMQSACNIFQFTHDAKGNMYYAGDMIGGVYFDTSFVTVGANGYILSIDTAMKKRWHKKVGDIVYSLSFDQLNNIYPCGTQMGQVNSIDTFIITNFDGVFKPKLYMAKLDSNLSCKWVKQSIGGAFGGYSISGKGCNFIAGRVDSCTVFDTANLCPSSIIGQNFFLKTSYNGSVVRQFTYDMYGNIPQGFSFSSDSNNNLLIVGSVDTSVSINGQTLTKLPGANNSLFILKVDTNRSVIWLKSVSTKGSIVGTLNTNFSGYTYVYGIFTDTVFLENYILLPQGSKNMFVTRFNPQGQCLGVVTVPNAKPKSVTEDANGNAIITGSIGPGNSQFGSITLSSAGGEDFFLAKLSALTGANSISTITEDGFLNIYANPNAGLFTIQVPQAMLGNNSAQLLVYGPSGELIKDEATDISQSKVSVNLGEVVRGLYTVVLQGSNRRFTGRVVVE